MIKWLSKKQKNKSGKCSELVFSGKYGGHIDLMVCDIHGNPCGKALTIPYEMYGSSKTNKSSVLHALDRVKHIVERRHVECVFLEELKGFLDSKSRILNDGGNVFRRIVSSIPCGELRDWLIRKLSSVPGCHVEFVSAAYTSKVNSNNLIIQPVVTILIASQIIACMVKSTVIRIEFSFRQSYLP